MSVLLIVLAAGVKVIVCVQLQLNDGLVRRCQDALAQSREPTEAPPLLSRRDRSLDAWKAELEGSARGDYRDAALSDDALAAAVENASLDPDQRVGAAHFVAHRLAYIM